MVLYITLINLLLLLLLLLYIFVKCSEIKNCLLYDFYFFILKE